MGVRGNTLDMELRGADSMKANFKKYEQNLVVAGQRISQSVAEDIAVVARDLVAKDEGKVAANIRSGRDGSHGAKVVATRGGQRDIVPALLELGTYKMAPRPFMKPAGEMAMAAGAVYKAVREVGGLLRPRGGSF